MAVHTEHQRVVAEVVVAEVEHQFLGTVSCIEGSCSKNGISREEDGTGNADVDTLPVGSAREQSKQEDSNDTGRHNGIETEERSEHAFASP